MDDDYPTDEKIALFLSEYAALCRKHGVYIHSQEEQWLMNIPESIPIPKGATLIDLTPTQRRWHDYINSLAYLPKIAVNT